MTEPLPIYTIEKLRPLLNRAEVISVVRDALIRHAERLFAMANLILTDDHSQCLELSDYGRAVRAGQVTGNADKALGLFLNSATPFVRRPSDITIVDLTGLAVQDIAVANLFVGKLGDLSE
jgi:ornithine cyclodeaminase/alanine dehydrogenase-like protein (mu-crystallin family)